MGLRLRHMTMRACVATVLLASVAACTPSSPVAQERTPAATASDPTAVHGCPSVGFRRGIVFDARPFALGHPSVRSLRVVLNRQAIKGNSVPLNARQGFLVDDALRPDSNVLVQVEPQDQSRHTLGSSSIQVSAVTEEPYGHCRPEVSIKIRVSASGTLTSIEPCDAGASGPVYVLVVRR
jgi:hypothetical protein